MVSDNLYLQRICAGRKGIGGIYAILAIFLLLSGAVAYFLNTTSSSPVVQDNNIRKLSSYEELETYLKSSGGGGIYGGPQGVMRAEMETGTSKAVSSVPGGSQDYSQTNIQVEGVDEADIVKNDGKYIYAVSGSRISIVDAYPAETAKIISAIDFNGTVNEIFVNGNTLVAFGQKYETYSSGETDENTASSKMAIYPRYSQKTAIMIYDISDRSNPSVSGDIRIDGNYYDSRMIGKYVYVIANQPTYYMAASKIPLPEITSGGRCIIGQCSSAGFPDVYYFDGSQGNVFTTIAAINLDNPADITGKIILTNYAQGMYVSEKNIYITYTKWLSETDYIERFVEVIKPLVPSDVQSKIDAVMFLDVSKQTKWQAVNEIMETYVGKLSDEKRKALEEKGKEKIDELQREIAREREKTIVQKISIDSGTINYVTNGEVPGNTLNQFSMDEYNGYFRIATTTSGNGGMTPVLMATSVQGRVIQQEAAVVENTGSSASTAVESQATPQKKTGGLSSEEQQMTETRPTPAPQPSRIESQNNVYVLDRDLKIIGRLEGLAPGERIYSARFLGDKAYMVTFRQIDPLFVIDMSSPENPVVLGYLKIPGVSDYMHPYDETHVIGIGRDSTSDGRIKGMKISLFDVSDVANPAEISKYIIGGQGTYSEAIYDHRAILFSREKNLLVLPVSEYSQSETGSSPEKTWEYSYWQGAYVFGINLDSGITLKGKITHKNTGDSLSTMRTEGRFGSALKFSGANGAGNYVSYPRIFTGKHNEITFEAWINPSKYNNETAWIAGHRVHVGGAQLLINPGKAEWLVAGGSTDVHYAISSTSEIPLNTWTHVAGTFDGSTLRLYVNGKEETNLNATFDVLWDGDYRGSFIGKDGSGWFSAFNGKIDDVRVYSRVLSPAEISSQYSGNEVSSVGLEGWWKFDETTGDTVVDSSGKGNDGTILDYASKMSSYYDYTTQIRRSLYIDNVLYTISQKLVKMNSLADMTAINRVELPYEEYSYPVRY